MRKVRATAWGALSSKNPQEQIVPADTFKLSGIISTDAAYVSPETDHADIIIRFGCAIFEIRNGVSASLIENVVKVMQNAE